MRVIAGHLKGRYIAAPTGHRTHPMSEKARGGLFSAIGDIESLTVLDAYAGSGALAIEAISRGAASAIAIDSDKTAYQTIERNTKALCIDHQIEAIRANSSNWSDLNPSRQFDVVICDPPFDNLQTTVLQKLVRHVRLNGLYVLSWPGKLEVPDFQSLELLKARSYGDNQLAFYRRVV